MGPSLDNITRDVAALVRELVDKGGIRSGQLIVFGVSTSEVLGRTIGSSGTEEVAEAIYEGIVSVQADVGFTPVFQCCEHLNRALVMERSEADRLGLDIVHAIPVPRAGGAMAAYAFKRLNEPCLVESIRCHAGIDIGDTLIGMHLRPVAVPLRTQLRSIGEAHVTAAFTRPKLIG